jgi:hypothetical protein
MIKLIIHFEALNLVSGIETGGSKAMAKVEYVVRSKRTRWTRKFKTLAEAEACIKVDWSFNTDATAYIEKRVIETIAV